MMIEELPPLVAANLVAAPSYVWRRAGARIVMRLVRERYGGTNSGEERASSRWTADIVETVVLDESNWGKDITGGFVAYECASRLLPGWRWANPLDEYDNSYFGNRVALDGLCFWQLDPYHFPLRPEVAVPIRRHFLAVGMPTGQ